MDIRTKVKVVISMIVEHEGIRSQSDIENIASRSVHQSNLAGASIIYGGYRVVETGRSIESE